MIIVLNGKTTPFTKYHKSDSIDEKFIKNTFFFFFLQVSVENTQTIKHKCMEKNKV